MPAQSEVEGDFQPISLDASPCHKPETPDPPPVTRGGEGQSAPNLRPPAAKKAGRASPEPRRRGGPRPGSGPPKGNLNALRHGRYSQQQQALISHLAQIPQARQALVNMANRNRRRQKAAEEQAARLLAALLQRAAEGAFGNDQPLFDGPDTDDPPNDNFFKKTTKP